MQYAPLDGFVKLELLLGEGEHDLYESGFVGLPHYWFIQIFKMVLK